MHKYTIRMNVIIMGLENIVIETSQEFKIGQSITISPTQNLKVQDTKGNYVELTPGVSMSGTIVSKE